MAHITADRVRETTSTTALSDFALGGAVSDCLSFASAMANGDTCWYCAVLPLSGQFEIGLGTFSAPSTLRRTALIASSTGSFVSFSAGVKDLFMDLPGGKVLSIESFHALTGKSVPASADEFAFVDSAAGNALKKITWAQILAALPTSAATLTTPRYIDNTLFNGSADIAVVAPAIFAASNKTTPVDADEFGFLDSAAGYALKNLTWANLKAALAATAAQVWANTAGYFLTTDQAWAAAAEVALADGTSVAATFTNGSTTVGATAHGKSVDDPIHFTTAGTLPTNFVANTEYYVKTVIGANSITVSATRGGAAITAGSAGSGVHTMIGRILVDGSKGLNFLLSTIGGNRTLAKPYNMKAGQQGRIRIVQDGTGSRTLTINSADGWKTAASGGVTLSTAASSDDRIYYDAISSTSVGMSPTTSWA